MLIGYLIYLIHIDISSCIYIYMYILYVIFLIFLHCSTRHAVHHLHGIFLKHLMDSDGIFCHRTQKGPKNIERNEQTWIDIRGEVDRKIPSGND